MVSHGVQRPKKPSPSGQPPIDPAVEAEQRERLEEYKLLNKTLLSRNSLKEYLDPHSLHLSTALLKLNPDHLTAWSFRRHCLLALCSVTPTDQFTTTLSSELDFTLQSFRRNPKAYPIWEHRKWVLSQLCPPNWTFELGLIDQLLAVDGRNFHAWHYRQHIITNLKLTHPSQQIDNDELNFTTRQIEANFSNFSAWHYRSQLIHAILSTNQSQHLAILKSELEWLKNAIWIDPNDQSAWLYRRWLISHTTDEQVLSEALRSVQELLEVEPDSKWALAALFHHCPNRLDLLQRLKQLDPLRANRYMDLQTGS